MSSAEYNADDLNKLFTDKNQRARIDAARSGLTGSAKQTDKVKVDGYVTRSDGKSVVWINGQSTLDSSRVGNIRVHQSSMHKDKKVGISIDGESRRLRPGETWSKSTGKIVDSQ
ncbi:MAG: hypothetical protein KJN89_03325 [Gammaproteobacteria bacterium]|nr:hypothetical protein [Gammaproteobacteria bacterium]NNJ49382.1 hypothetical protein [Gammaproteobacteria bacterium]